MNSKERYLTALNQKKPDRMPIKIGNYGSFLCNYYGISIEQYLEKADIHAEYFCRFLDEFAIDSAKAGLGYIFYGCGPELGVHWQFASNDLPTAIGGVLDEPSDLNSFKIPVKPSGYFKRFLDINRLVEKEVGNRKHLTLSVLGPFSAAIFLRGFEKLLLDIYQNIDFFNELLQKLEKLSIFLGHNCMNIGVDCVNLFEIFLVPGVIRPEIFQKCIAPHDNVVCQELSDPPLDAPLSEFMGKRNDENAYKNGKAIYEYFFGTSESIDNIKSVSNNTLPGYPPLISISGRALTYWTAERIIEFINDAIGYYKHEAELIPALYFPSIQASDPEIAKEIANKLQSVQTYIEENPF